MTEDTLWLRALRFRGEQLSVVAGVVTFPQVKIDRLSYYLDCVYCRGSAPEYALAPKSELVTRTPSKPTQWHIVPLDRAKEFLLQLDPNFDIEVFQLQQELQP